VWAMRRAVAISALMTLLGGACGYLLTLHDPDLFYGFVPEPLTQGRNPTTTPEELRKVLYTEPEGQGLSGFAGFLFTHNAQIGLLCFAVGVAAGVPVALLLFSNGLMLGAFGALYANADLGLPFWLWVLPHGVTELLAVVLCGAAGLRLGASLVFPGRYSRLDSLALEGRNAAVAVLGCIALFLVAGILEGYFRQLVHHDGVRLAVVVATSLLWILYFAGLGSRSEPPSERPGESFP